MNIRPMHLSDLDFAAECTTCEGWASETRKEFEGFLAYAPGGCFVAEVDGRREGQVSVGPWVIAPGAEHPGDLLECLALEVGDEDLGLGVLDANAQAVAALRAFGLTEHSESPGAWPWDLQGDTAPRLIAWRLVRQPRAEGLVHW